jgi:hypothetical protein
MKRRRRLLRIVLVVLLAMIAAAAVPIVLALRTMLAEPSITVDYARQMRERQETLLGSDAADADARWATFVDLTMRCSDRVEAVDTAWHERHLRGELDPRNDNDWGYVDVGYVLRGPTIPHAIEREREAIAAVEADGIFDELAGLVGGPIGLRPSPAAKDELLLMAVMPELAKSRGLAKTRAASMRLALHAGDRAQVVAAFEEILAISETIGHQRTLIDHLVGQAVAAMALNELRSELDEAAFDEATCRRLADAINAYRLPSITIALEGERAIFRDFVQRTFTDDGNGDGYLIPRLAEPETPAVAQFLMAFATRFFIASRREHVETYDAMIDAFIDRAKTPVEERGEPPAGDPGKGWAARRLMLVWLMIPAVERAVQNADYAAAQLEATLVRLAIERFETQHGRPPATLDELVPDFLAAPPRDPVNGGPFGYRLLENDPDGRGFELYSRGTNGVDDVGAPDRFTESLDFPLNAPRDAAE